MAPSRGLCNLRHVSRSGNTLGTRFDNGSRVASARNPGRYSSSSSTSTFSERLSDPVNSVQSYVSRSSDPYVNLAIEDHILRKSPPDSAVLFLYTNRPCVVIGRNQNPWREVNLSILKAATQKGGQHNYETEPPGIGDVHLLRRRSGGGTVFHDLGNVNWSITTPLRGFTRDKHAEMVVRVLRSVGIHRARVNERHDIVLDQGHEKRVVADPQDTHRTPYTVEDGAQQRPLKVSGSAYKFTHGRALHHATTLLASPNLHIIPQYLHSPAKPYLDAKGVESVSSPVGNIGLENEDLQRRLQAEFAAVYAPGRQIAVEDVTEDHLAILEIKKGYEELRTNDWILSQTPQFTLKFDSSHHTQEDGATRIEMNVHQGIIKSFDYNSSDCSTDLVDKVRSALLGSRLQDIRDWYGFMESNIPSDQAGLSRVIKYLDEFLPIPSAPGS